MDPVNTRDAHVDTFEERPRSTPGRTVVAGLGCGALGGAVVGALSLIGDEGFPLASALFHGGVFGCLVGVVVGGLTGAVAGALAAPLTRTRPRAARRAGRDLRSARRVGWVVHLAPAGVGEPGRDEHRGGGGRCRRRVGPGALVPRAQDPARRVLGPLRSGSVVVEAGTAVGVGQPPQQRLTGGKPLAGATHRSTGFEP